MDILRKNGVYNLQDLQLKIKTSKKAQIFAKNTGLPKEYVKVLRREINSLTPPPTPLNKFPDIKPDSVQKLANKGIKNTFQLFSRIKTPQDRENLAQKIGIDEEELLLLTKLTDLSRVKYVGPVFASLIIQSGADSLENLRNSDPSTLFNRMNNINLEKKYTRARFVEADIEQCIKLSKDVPLSIQY
jgi:hypothetical protein